MYARILRNATHIRRFTISSSAGSGWEVRDEQDSRIIWERQYRDWHRVERAKLTFSLQADGLRDAGWVDA